MRLLLGRNQRERGLPQILEGGLKGHLAELTSSYSLGSSMPLGPFVCSSVVCCK